jgi:hypothetical protein
LLLRFRCFLQSLTILRKFWQASNSREPSRTGSPRASFNLQIKRFPRARSIGIALKITIEFIAQDDRDAGRDRRSAVIPSRPVDAQSVSIADRKLNISTSRDCSMQHTGRVDTTLSF